MAFPDTILDIKVYLYYLGTWNDVTSDVYKATESQISITRGRSSPQEKLNYDIARLKLKNTDGKYSPRNPSSPLYGVIGRNTPIWITANSSWRFVGYVSAWPVRWAEGGADVWVDLECSGTIRRLQLGAAPLKGAIRNYLEVLDPGGDGAHIAYWPCEDSESATRIAPFTDGAEDLKVDGTIQLQASSVFKCSDLLPIMGTGRIYGNVPFYVATDEIQLLFLLSIPSGGIANNTPIVDIDVSGTFSRIQVCYATGGGLYINVYDNNTSGWLLFETTGTAAMALDGKESLISIELTPEAPKTRWTISTYTVNDPSVITATALFTNDMAVGRCTKLWFNSSRTMGDCVIGHICIRDSVHSIAFMASATNAYRGDPIDARISLICYNTGMEWLGDSCFTTMGPMDVDSAYNQLVECDEIQGITFETRNELNQLTSLLQYDPFNQIPTLTISYNDGVLLELEPVEDDTLLENVVTVIPERGAKYRTAIETGAMGTSGVGIYEAEYNLNLDTDSGARNAAGWRAYVGTRDDARYPVVTINVRQLAVKQPALLADLKSLDIGTILCITDPPSWLPPEDINLFIIGYEETFWQYGWEIAFKCLPGSRWEVFRLNDGEHSRLQPVGLTLGNNVTTDGTSWEVVSTAGSRPIIDSATYPTMYPIPALCEGEEVSLTACTDTTSPQTFTVTRSVNGVVRAHNIGAVITFKVPTPLGL